MAVVGLYDKGKTFCLNNLSCSNLPSGKKVNTKGLSFKYVNIDEGTRLILLDTAGSYSPVKVENNMNNPLKYTLLTFLEPTRRIFKCKVFGKKIGSIFNRISKGKD